MNTVERINGIIETVNDDLKRAKMVYKDDVKRVQMKTCIPINISRGDAVTRLAEIARESRKASDDFYAKCQALVFFIDNSCRGLINEETPSETIRKIYKTINNLNCECEIEADYNGTFNNQNMGSFAEVSYIASIESKTIEKHWEILYNSRPDVIELQKKQEAERIANEEIRKKKAEEQKLKEETEEKLKKERETKMKAQYDEIHRQCYQLVEEFDLYIDKTIESGIFSYKSNLLIRLNDDMNAKIKTRDSLGLFKLGEKNRLSKEIDIIQAHINALNTLDYTDEKIDVIKNFNNEKKNRYRAEVELYLENRFPFRKRQREEIEKQFSDSIKKKNYNLEKKIFEQIKKGKTAVAGSAIMNRHRSVSPQKIGAHLRKMAAAGAIEQIISRREASYIALIENFEDYVVPHIDGIENKWYEDPAVAQIPYPVPPKS